MYFKMSGYTKLFLSVGATIGIVGGGYILMRVTSPDKEEMMKRLPKEHTNPKALAETERRNAQLFKVLAENTSSNDPVWKVKGQEDLNRVRK